MFSHTLTSIDSVYLSLLGKKIRLDSEKDIEHWCNTLCCCPESLFDGIKTQGPFAINVYSYIKENEQKQITPSYTLGNR
jgi:hypothetical protein